MHRLHLVYSVDNDLSGLTMLVIVAIMFILFLSAAVAYYLKKETFVTRLLEMVSGDNAWNFALLGCLFSGAVLYLTILFSIPPFVENREVYNARQYKVVEGKVNNYIPMPYAGHADESFTVDGITFNFSDYDPSVGGYHNAASHGGVIRPNLYVRISYYPTSFRNIILKLEIE